MRDAMTDKLGEALTQEFRESGLTVDEFMDSQNYTSDIEYL
ncbi:unnamed protein product, partial [marine sediment metagenome]